MALSCVVLLISLVAFTVGQQLPVGVWSGTINIVPFNGQSGRFTCLTQCAPVAAPFYVFWNGNTLNINISAAQTPQGCGVGAQLVSITSVTVNQRYPYYGGVINMAGFPSAYVCFVFDTGLFVVLLDGHATCPQTNARPSCIQSGISIIDTWTGTVMPVPSGTYRGSISIAPYTSVSGGFTCLNCPAVVAPSSLTWYMNTLQISISQATGPSGCGLVAQSYSVRNVVPYGPSYPGYFGGVLNVNTNVCLMFTNPGVFAIKLDGKGSCPTASERASCTNVAGPNVAQVWTGYYPPHLSNGTETLNATETHDAPHPLAL